MSFNIILYKLCKPYFKACISIELTFKINFLAKFLLFKLFIYPSALKRLKFFWDFTPQTLQRSAMKPLTSRPQPAFYYNIQKLDLCSKMDISKTAWINACIEYSCYHNNKGSSGGTGSQNNLSAFEESSCNI